MSKLKERRNRGAVWFDIIGRGDENYERRNFERFYQDYNRRQLPRIAGSFWWSLPGREKLFATAVTIDISAMKEAPHILDFHEDMTTPTENREYRIHGSPNDDEKGRNVLAKNGIDLANPGAYELAKNKGLGNYLPKTNPADGFVTNTRIRPKQITGVVFKAMKPAHEDEAGKEGRGLRMVLDQKELHEKANGVIEQVRKVYEGREADAPPIYDMLGNLHWPKQMSYEEVQKFVAEREDKKSRPEQKD